MVLADFASSFFLRDFFARWVRAYHPDNLQKLAEALPAMAAEGAAREAADGRAPRPLAIVLDIDEVLLCNLHENVDDAHAFRAADFFADATGAPWDPAARLNPALPGARGLLRAAAHAGLRIFFVTGRDEALRAETRENFALVGFGACLGVVDAALAAGPGTALHMCPAPLASGASVAGVKRAARARIAQNYRIVANVGDQVSDMGELGDHQVWLPHPFYATP